MSAFRLTVGDAVYEGPAVSLSGGDVDSETIVDAISAGGDRPEGTVSVTCPDPGTLYESVGSLRESMTFDRRGALAELARRRGHEPPQAPEIRRLRDEIGDTDASPEDLADARRRVASAGEEEARLREAVAAARGRLRTLRNLDEPDEAAAEELEDAIARLTEAETERIAAQERLCRLERRARDDRDERERRLERQDRLANRRREARAWLAERVYDRFAAATAALARATGVDAEAGSEPGDYAGDSLTAAAAVVRVAAVGAPVVVATDRFGGAARAARLLDAPVVRVSR